MSGLIDLSLLPAPDVVEALDYETLYAERKAMFIALFPVEKRDAITRTLALESDPITKLLQLSVYHELLLRQRVNEAASANMLAYAAGSDLDQLAANVNVQRLVITAEDTEAIPSVEAIMESDADLRTRAQQAFEGLSVAGPTAAYEFHARSADGRVADASAVSPSPAAVTVTVLSREGNGSASDELLQTVGAALNAENVRPVADRVTVQSAEIVPYEITAALYVYPGPEAEPIRIAAETRLQAYITAQHRLGRDVRRSAIFAALHVEGVQRVDLESPVEDIVLDKSQASYCDSWVLSVGGSDE
ncbi:baseplate assembly protein [Pectobacterium carotovorum]|uniref:baseplate assembly protein n=1 Tax=Pectobacterium carotovorum TaxID=554 RepID=UPI00207F9D51|nr:baseplate assembly protein [Pectobacterium carotovorum]GKV91753.1 baseplate assembly protein [Pectobacterium carotovorum subsp. carotovorum]